MSKEIPSDNMVILEVNVKFDTDEPIQMAKAEFELVLRNSIRTLYGVTGEAMRYEVIKFDSSFQKNISLKIKKKDEERFRASMTLCKTAAEIPIALNVVNSGIERSET
ncbi:DgyrCDS1636 [Dimorphilus gyrociliatus]|uniref:DgyrCDS1636 n=1 Tax=Dimorphilus gyrociliatus TaxID=2664684 RepID=A0A7I8VB45_9ANNE|nr:DgyrCDS1636 [Dimorphilus gyrociliatus]